MTQLRLGVSLIVLLWLVASLAGCGGSRLGGEAPTSETVRAVARPTVDFTSLPSLGKCDVLKGVVHNANPKTYDVVVYIRVDGCWWVKPFQASPRTPIWTGGAFTCSVCTGGHDQDADKIVAFVVPKTYRVPTTLCLASLPRALYSHSVAWVETTRTRQGNFRSFTFPWGKYDWAVKSGANMGPGPNDFSDRNAALWLDDDWKLHLTIAKQAGKWNCTEVINRSALGYGRYVFTVDSYIDRLDPNSVLGLFNWDDNAPPHYRELDLEFSRWSVPADRRNAQYVVQPWDTPGNRFRFAFPHVATSTHFYDWRPGVIVFESHEGSSVTGRLLKHWEYRGSGVPKPGRENTHFNLWLYNGQPPSNGRPVEVVLSRFAFAK